MARPMRPRAHLWSDVLSLLIALAVAAVILYGCGPASAMAPP